jgi:hypothetical protein
MSDNPYSFITHPERLALSEAVSTPMKRDLIELRIGMWLSLVSLLVMLLALCGGWE